MSGSSKHISPVVDEQKQSLDPLRFRKLLCAVDGSPAACRAARIAATLALQCGAELTFVSVAREAKLTPEVSGYLASEGLKGQAQPWLSSDANSCLSAAIEIAREVGVESVQRLVVVDEPADGIVETAKSVSADCVVLGKHGHGAMRDLVLGSVSRKVIDRIDRPVLLVK